MTTASGNSRDNADHAEVRIESGKRSRAGPRDEVIVTDDTAEQYFAEQIAIPNRGDVS